MATWRPARAFCARTAFQTSPQHCGTTRESSDALVWRRMTARGTLSSWSNWTAGDVNGLFLIISDQEMPMIGFMRLMSLATAVAMVTTMSVSAAEIHVMSGGAPKEVFALLAPKFEQQTDNKVEFTYAVITELREKLGAGTTADVLVLPTPVLDSLAKDGKVRADSRAIFGTVGVSVVVEEGAPRPDISSKEKFRDAMLAARSVVHATPGKTPSGTHMRKVMEQLGIADAMAKKIILKPALDGGVQLVAAGQAEIGIYPASEVAGVEGLIIVGPLPAEINLEIVYGAAVATDSAAPNAASAFVKFMAAPENRFVWKEGGFEPPTNLNSN